MMNGRDSRPGAAPPPPAPTGRTLAVLCQGTEFERMISRRKICRMAQIAVLAVAAVAPVACDQSVNVGDRRATPTIDDGGPETSSVVVQDAGEAGASGFEWRRLSPAIPCTIWALDERSGNDMVVGCDGGQVFRFDGVDAKVSLTAEENAVFGLVWLAPDESIFAAAQIGTGTGATSELYRYDGATWSKDASLGTQRIMALTGIDAHDVWMARAQELMHFDGSAWKSTYVASKGEFRSCAFTTSTQGLCVGTEGLAVSWNGATWTAVNGAPWSNAAELFGVDIAPLTGDPPLVLFGEPTDAGSGNYECQAATQNSDGTFSRISGTQNCTANYSISRKRVGHAYLNLKRIALLSSDETYGDAYAFDPQTGGWQRLCGPILASSAGVSNTHVGGISGFFGTLIVNGTTQIGVQTFGATDRHFASLSVGRDGTAWARVGQDNVCGSVTNRLMRFETPDWKDIAAPETVQSGSQITTASSDSAYTLTDDLSVYAYAAGKWSQQIPSTLTAGNPQLAFSLWESAPSDLWVGTAADDFGHWDGRLYTSSRPSAERRQRQIEQVTGSPDGDVWAFAQSTDATDPNSHIYHLDSGKIADFDLGPTPPHSIRTTALDRTHAWMSGTPARAWNGTTWSPLPFNATAVWARTPSEVWFAQGATLVRWNGQTLDQSVKGQIPITALEGSPNRAFAVGPGGLTLEFTSWPPNTQ